MPLESITEEALPDLIRIVGEDAEVENETTETKNIELPLNVEKKLTQPFFYPLVASNKVFFEGSKNQSDHSNQLADQDISNPFVTSHRNSSAEFDPRVSEKEITVKIEGELEQEYARTSTPNFDDAVDSDLQVHRQMTGQDEADQPLKYPAFVTNNPRRNEYFSFEPNERLTNTVFGDTETDPTAEKLFKLNLIVFDDLEKSIGLPEINAEAEELESSKDLTSTMQIAPRLSKILQKSKEGLMNSSLDEIRAKAHTWHVNSQSKRSDSEGGINPMDSGNLTNLQINDSNLGSQKNSSKTATRYLNNQRRVSKSFAGSGTGSATMELNRKKSIVTTLLSLDQNLPKLSPAHISIQKSGLIEAVVANSYKAIGKSTNDARYSISLNAQSKFQNRVNSISNKESDSASLVSIFNGFGGPECADYLANYLHIHYFDDLDCDGLLIQSARRIFADIDSEILGRCKYGPGDSSGASALSLYFTGNSLISINLGDSRCVLSSESGKKVADLSNDHRPDRLSEFNRIIENGLHLERVTLNSKTGEVETHLIRKFQEVKNLNSLEKNHSQGNFGRWRIFPSGASVARCFGLKLAKDPKIGGCPGVISTEPEVLDFELENADFAILASDLISQRRI